MRRHLASLVALAFLLFALGAIAQTAASSGKQETTTTTTTTQQTTTGPERVFEGCVMKEASDFFLIPAHGTPIELQTGAGQDLTAHEGHKVKVHGVESALSAAAAGGAGAMGGTTGTSTSATSTKTGAQSSTHSIGEPVGSSSSSAGAASGTGDDLHRLASKQIAVTNVDHVADTCPVNWNPGVSSKRGASK